MFLLPGPAAPLPTSITSEVQQNNEPHIEEHPLKLALHEFRSEEGSEVSEWAWLLWSFDSVDKAFYCCEAETLSWRPHWTSLAAKLPLGGSDLGVCFLQLG